jgi:hypothetical protein
MRGHNKPRLSEFMIRGYTLREALEISDRWDNLSKKQKQSLGFTPSSGSTSLPSLQDLKSPSEQVH